MYTFSDGSKMLSDGTFIDRFDSSLLVRFFFFPIEDEKRSKEEGRPIFSDVEMIEIITPGSKDVFHGKVTDEYRNRFSRQYKAFKESNNNVIDGTLLSELPFISAADRKELQYFNVFTAEQLINMADANIDRLGISGRNLVKKAKAYLESAKSNSFVAKITEENENLKREMALLKEQMQQILQMKEEAEEDGKVAKFRKNEVKSKSQNLAG